MDIKERVNVRNGEYSIHNGLQTHPTLFRGFADSRRKSIREHVNRSIAASGTSSSTGMLLSQHMPNGTHLLYQSNVSIVKYA
jgi:hypothetical protein